MVPRPFLPFLVPPIQEGSGNQTSSNMVLPSDIAKLVIAKLPVLAHLDYKQQKASLIPRPSPALVFDRLQYKRSKLEPRKAWAQG